jgi:hypothetical protein
MRRTIYRNYDALKIGVPSHNSNTLNTKAEIATIVLRLKMRRCNSDKGYSPREEEDEQE